MDVDQMNSPKQNKRLEDNHSKAQCNFGAYEVIAEVFCPALHKGETPSQKIAHKKGWKVGFAFESMRKQEKVLFMQGFSEGIKECSRVRRIRADREGGRRDDRQQF